MGQPRSIFAYFRSLTTWPQPLPLKTEVSVQKSFKSDNTEISFHIALQKVIVYHHQCDKIGQFLNILGKKIVLQKMPKHFMNVWAIFKQISFLCKNLIWLLIW